MKTTKNKLAVLGILAFVLMASTPGAYACDDDYFARRDSVSIGLGDANATNLAVQTIDPWPAHSHNTRIKINGKRTQLGITAYEHNKSKEPRPFSASELGNRDGGGASAGGGAGLTQ
jgi:hypothetical protein